MKILWKKYTNKYKKNIYIYKKCYIVMLWKKYEKIYQKQYKKYIYKKEKNI